MIGGGGAEKATAAYSAAVAIVTDDRITSSGYRWLQKSLPMHLKRNLNIAGGKSAGTPDPAMPCLPGCYSGCRSSWLNALKNSAWNEAKPLLQPEILGKGSGPHSEKQAPKRVPSKVAEGSRGGHLKCI